MEAAVFERPKSDVTAVALKAFARISDHWSLTLKEAASLADMSESTWKRAKKAGYQGDLTQDQVLRLSAIVGIYKSLELYFSAPIARDWVKLSNQGPEFEGTAPLLAMIRGGLPKIMRVRAYVDALRGGV
ncbi:MAG: antitoxin Xre-like helix-turn-helix domain-containing protein [Halocynthiibacter sp.]